MAAVIIRERRLLMVRERSRGPEGRHDGAEYWTLPGGGSESGETPEQGVAREVAEEVGLTCLSARYLFDFPYPSGQSACYFVDVPEDEEPRLGVDLDRDCDCPRMVGIDWFPLPTAAPEALPIDVLKHAALTITDPAEIAQFVPSAS